MHAMELELVSEHLLHLNGNTRSRFSTFAATQIQDTVPVPYPVLDYKSALAYQSTGSW